MNDNVNSSHGFLNIVGIADVALNESEFGEKVFFR